MKTIDIEKLNQLVSRTDISGNDKVKWLIDFIDGKELHQQEKNMYSEEEVYNILVQHTIELFKGQPCTLDEFFEQFKKK